MALEGPIPEKKPDDNKKLSPEREVLEVKLKEIEIDQKLHDLATNKLVDELEIERFILENEQVRKGAGGFSSPLDQLLSVARAWCIDNQRTITSDPVLKSIWEEDEMAEIKSLIMKKARKL